MARRRHHPVCVPTQELVARFLASFREFPPRQRPASFTVDQVIQKLEHAPSPLH